MERYSDRYFLVMVLEEDPETKGLVLAALKRELVVAMPLSSAAEIRTTIDHIRPRVLVLDVVAPDEEELDLVRAVRAHDMGEEVSIVLLGDVPEQVLPLEMCELVDAYIRKPTDWRRVARAVIDFATGRRPPSTGVSVMRTA